MVVSGIVGRNAEPLLRQSVREALPANTPDDGYALRLDAFDGPYCDILDAIRPVAAQPMTVGLRDGATRLVEDQYIIPRATLPGFQAYTYFDYFSGDGTMAHLQPSPAFPSKQAAAGSTVTIGKAGEGGWQVNPPFGTDMVLAIASSAPLFTPERPQDDSVAAYVAALRASLEAAVKKGVKLSAGVSLVQTVAK